MPSIGVPSGCGILVYMENNGRGSVSLYRAAEYDGNDYRFYVYNRSGQYLGLSNPSTDGDNAYFVWEYSELLNACLNDVSDEVILADIYPNVKPALRFDCAISSLSDMVGRKLYLTRYPLLTDLVAALPLNKSQGCIFDGVYVSLKKIDTDTLEIADLTCNEVGSKALVPSDPVRDQRYSYYQITGEACDEEFGLQDIVAEFGDTGMGIIDKPGEAEISFPVFGLYI